MRGVGVGDVSYMSTRHIEHYRMTPEYMPNSDILPLSLILSL